MVGKCDVVGKDKSTTVDDGSTTMNTTSTDTEIHTPAHWQIHPWMGVFAATLCAFHEDESLDEEGLRSYIAGLCAVDGLKGLVPNGHTGVKLFGEK